ncbi:glycosyltransferase family 2 protein [Desulfovibrio sp. OttesenSCG-928-C14]|nr:glycosyltransferase family 2 protein [Desulfovibrio sp. OttesenSCG-928-C14]
MKVNITVVTHNRLELTKKCLQSLLEKTSGQFCVTVVDNASADGTREYLKAQEKRHSRLRAFFLRSNMGVAVAANLGWAQVESDYYVKLDNDIEILDSAWLERLVAAVEGDKKVAMAGYLLLDWDCTKESVILEGGHSFILSDLCNGGCVLIPRHAHETLGFWIEDHGKYGYEDKNYSDRAQAAGYLVGYIPSVPLPVNHLGFEEGQVNSGREQAKKSNIESLAQGERLYVFNKLLFDKGLRGLRVERRYLPYFDGGAVHFRSNPAYAPIIKMQQNFLNKISYQGQGETISVDMSKIRS